VRFPQGLRALNHPDYRRFYIGQVVSQVGSWMQSVGQAWLVLQLTGSPLKLGLIGTLIQGTARRRRRRYALTSPAA